MRGAPESGGTADGAIVGIGGTPVGGVMRGTFCGAAGAAAWPAWPVVGAAGAGGGGGGAGAGLTEAGGGGGGGGVCCDAVAHAGSVAAATSARLTSPTHGKRSGARPFMIMTSLLSSTRRLVARMPSKAIDGAPRTAAPDRASSDSAYARRPFGSAEMTHASHASSACSRNAERTNQNSGFHHQTMPATSSIQPIR